MFCGRIWDYCVSKTILAFLVWASLATCQSTDEDPCPSGWTNVPAFQTCIRFSGTDEIETWQAARGVCQQSGGDLIKISSSDFNDIVVELWDSNQDYFAIGLNDLEEEGHFKWLDETSRTTFTNWYDAQPSYGFSQDCVSMRDRWSEQDCARDQRYICQVQMTDGGTCPNGWDSVPAFQTCLRFSNADEIATWQLARGACRQSGGDLIKITNSDFNNIVVDLWSTQQDTFFIGLNDLNQESYFKWLDETTETTFTYWDNRQPGNGHNSDCVAMNPRWIDYPCAGSIRYICQVPHTPESTTEPATERKSESTTESATDATTETETEPTTESRTESKTEPVREATTEQTTASTTESPTEPVLESTTESTTQPVTTTALTEQPTGVNTEETTSSSSITGQQSFSSSGKSTVSQRTVAVATSTAVAGAVGLSAVGILTYNLWLKQKLLRKTTPQTDP